MLIVQLTGLSGAGKTTLSFRVKDLVEKLGYRLEVIDGDEYRKTLWPGLGFSPNERAENINKLGFIANVLARNNIIVIISAINPYEFLRVDLKNRYKNVKTVQIKCELTKLFERDTKKLYYRASLPSSHPDKIENLSGVNDIYEEPINPDLVIDTSEETIQISERKLYDFIISTCINI